ncbi:cuticle protein 21 [Eurosta solidaginis]|uniref:cuticle protein 21 n=1 Tax=Eurosta solidaginis TaxID=178769 RepID=UPI003530D9A1
MITKVALVLCFGISLAVASPIDAYGEHGAYTLHAAPIAYAPAKILAPAITYAAPAKILAPAPAAISHQVLHAAPPPAAIIKAAPIIKVAKVEEPEPYDPNPEYSFSYGVTDHHTGDSKSAEEHLKDGVVHGSYSLAEPDGTIRKVTYTADKVNGFQAVVEKQGEPKPEAVVAKHAVAVAAAPVVAKVAYAAPTITKVAYAAPALAKVAYAAPDIYYSHAHFGHR